MKHCLTVVFLALSASASASSRVEVSSLPQGQYADTEAATNSGVCSASVSDNRFRLLLELDAETDNCVMVEFGVDRDSSGALERSEVEFSVGWDCGEWVWRDRRGGTAASVVRSAGVRRLEWMLHLTPDKTARHLVAADRGTLFDCPAPPTFYSPAWNMARIVRRGPEPEMHAMYDISVFPLTIKLR